MAPVPGSAVSEAAEMRSESVVVTGSSISEPSGVIAPPEPMPTPTPTPTPLPQAGTLTAGDYDDTLNPELYKTYLDKVLQEELSGKELPFVDASNRIEVNVTDRLGKPAAFATVVMSDADGNALATATTGAKGKVFFYPAYDDLDDAVVVTATDLEGETERLRITDETTGPLMLSFDGDVSAPTKLDLLLTIDATGSMLDEMRYLQSEFLSITAELEETLGDIDIRAGLIVYRDRGDDYVVRDFDFTSDLEAFSAILGEQRADGGGDFPEAMQDAMAASVALSWRDDAIKVNMLVADAPPHDEDIAATWKAAEASREAGIHIVPLAASGVDGTAEFLMRAMGQITMGRYMFLTDDSGVGNAHAEPTVDCYVVTRLDSLVRRVLADMMTGTRVEPEGSEVIRVVGEYRLGRCEVSEDEPPPKRGN